MTPWLLALSLSAAAEEVDGATIQRLLAEFSPHASLPIPALSADQLDRLLDGRVLKVRLPAEGDAPVGAMAMLISPMSRSQLWLSSMDVAHFGTDEALTIHHLPLVGDEIFRWYGFLDLPAPFADRHFLVRTTINPRMPEATGNTMWERSWKLEEGFVETMAPEVAAGAVEGITGELYDAAIAVPVNYGAWLFIDLPDGRTLFAYHCASSLGGEIPDGLVTRYVFWGLDGLMERITDSAEAMPAHYTGSHPPILGGDSQPIPRY